MFLENVSKILQACCVTYDEELCLMAVSTYLSCLQLLRGTWFSN